MPTARVAFERVLRHVIAEWGVEARTAQWEDILDRVTRRLRGAPYRAVGARIPYLAVRGRVSYRYRGA